MVNKREINPWVRFCTDFEWPIMFSQIYSYLNILRDNFPAEK